MIKDIFFVVITFTANIIEGITGFAGTMLSMPAAMQLIGVSEAKIVLNLVAILVSSNIMIRNIKYINKRELIKLIFLMLIGMTIGIFLFNYLPTKILMISYGILIIIVALKGLISQKEINIPKIGLIIVVICSGIIHGMFLSGGALLVIYAVNVLKDKSVIRATLAPVWISLNSVMLVQDVVRGNFTNRIIILFLICVIPIFLALFIGEQLHKKVSQNFFIKLTYILLIISGSSLLL